MSATIGDSARRIAHLAWPVFFGQLSVVAFGTIDTLLVARYAAEDLAALSVGTAAYFTTFIGLMGIVLAVGPVTGRFFGAKKLHDAGNQLHQGVWLALMVSVPGIVVLVFPWPYLAVAKLAPDVQAKARIYLFVLAIALPAALQFTAWRAFTTAVSRPRIVMVLQFAALALKLPLSVVLIHGVPAIGIPALGVIGCAIATVVAMWAQIGIAWWIVRRDRFYAPFGVQGVALHPPDRRALAALWRLGLPMGGGMLIEVSGFTMMAIFIARLGTTPVAGHQIAVNVVSILFMVPLALANAAGTLVAQRVGANDLPDARRLSWHAVLIGTGIAAALGVLVALFREGVVGLYTTDAAVVAATLPLLAWLVVFHIADAAQTLTAFVLRAWHVATGPMFIYALSLWGVGLGGGYVLAFDVLGNTPAWMQGARGYWIACTAGLTLASTALIGLQGWVLRHQKDGMPSPAR